MLVYGPDGKLPSQMLQEMRHKEFAEFLANQTANEEHREAMKESLKSATEKEIQIKEETRLNWKVCEDQEEERVFLEELLPEEYKYTVTKFKMLDESSIKN